MRPAEARELRSRGEHSLRLRPTPSEAGDGAGMSAIRTFRELNVEHDNSSARMVANVALNERSGSFSVPTKGASTDRRRRWTFIMNDDGTWGWHVVKPDGTARSSPTAPRTRPVTATWSGSSRSVATASSNGSNASSSRRRKTDRACCSCLALRASPLARSHLNKRSIASLDAVVSASSIDTTAFFF
jgi:hypothetical protein